MSWIDHGTVLELGTDVAWASARAWAPAVVASHGRYYLYFSADHNIGVAVGETPAGPFRDLGRPLVPAGAYPGQMIDPAVFVDLDGTPYLYWGNGMADGVPLNADMTSFNIQDAVSWHPGEFCATLRGVARSPEIADLIGPFGTGVVTPGAAPG